MNGKRRDGLLQPRKLILSLLLGALLAGPLGAAGEGEFSRGFLGIYRKLMEIEDQILRACNSYDLRPELAKAVCLYESGGNANLTSWAGAKGYFQVMPRTFQLMGVRTNIEAGVKYLSQQLADFEREDYAVAAYNGGPANLRRGRSLRLETVQYVIGVGDFRSLLLSHEAEIRRLASGLRLHNVREGQGWSELSGELGLSVIELRMYNPFLAHRMLKAGNLVAYPGESEGPDRLFERDGDHLVYRSRPGDNYFHLAFIFDVELEQFRNENGIWRVQTLPSSTRLILRPKRVQERRLETVRKGDTFETIVARHEDSGADSWDLMRQNMIWEQAELVVGRKLEVPVMERKPTVIQYRVKQGDTLQKLARRFGVTVTQIQEANGMSRRNTRIIAGRTILIPQNA